MRAHVKAINNLQHQKNQGCDSQVCFYRCHAVGRVVEHACTSATTAFTWGSHSWCFLICCVAPVNLSVPGVIPYSWGDCFGYSNNHKGNVSRFLLVISAGITLCPYRRLMGKQPLLSVLSIRSSYKHYRFVTAVTQLDSVSAHKCQWSVFCVLLKSYCGPQGTKMAGYLGPLEEPVGMANCCCIKICWTWNQIYFYFS